MKIDRKIVIAALARDCEKSLPNMINLIEELREQFIWSEVVVVENDSKDETKNILFDWEKKKEGVTIFSQNYGTLTIPEESVDGIKPLVSFHRIEKMAFYRNIYIKYIKEIAHDIDNLIVIDVDVESFSIEGVVAAVLKCTGTFGAVFANGISVKRFFGFIYSRIFYDVFAVYEYPMEEPFSFTEKSLSRTLKTVMYNLKKDKQYPVISAFGGIGVYNYNAISNLEYTVISNGNNESEAVCEHIPFNTKVINLGYENFISREMVVIYRSHSFGAILKYYLPEKLFQFLFDSYCVFRNLINKIMQLFSC